MSEWQPIETAPKDGSPILVWPVNAGAGVIPYVARYHEFMNGDKLFRSWVEAAGEEWATYGDVTHWMPLPAPPQGRSE